MTGKTTETATPIERALLVGVELRSRDAAAASAEESLEELEVLAISAGAEVLWKGLQSRPAPDSATLIGSGKLKEIAELAESLAADVVIFDQDLTPTQIRNLDKALPCKVLDRTQLILDIFASRARTREGQLQVELAQLNYLLPRLTGHGKAMSRLGGGIGTRGPGETKLETDRRRIHTRIEKIEASLEAVRGHRGVQRQKRQSVPLATISLVGYTNAGKSTLFNYLTGAGVLADAKMFATLDPTVRQLTLPSRRRVLLSDTVGFIRSLPTTLVQAFRATLEEVKEAEILLHLVDGSAPQADSYVAHVEGVLEEIGAGATPRILVLTKRDRWAESDPIPAAARLSSGPSVAVSARTGEGVSELLQLIDRLLPLDPIVRLELRIPAADLSQRQWLYDYGRVIEERWDGPEAWIVAEAPESIARRLRSFAVRRHSRRRGPGLPAAPPPVAP